MKLEDLLGKDLYAQVQAKIDEANAKEEDKLKHIRYADLSEGEYVGKGKHDAEIDKLNGLLTGKDAELAQANSLIEELKKGTKGNEELQGKITAYTAQVAELQKQLEETKIKSAVKVALLADKAIDVDYLTFKLNEKLNAEGKKLELDDNGNVKDWKGYSESLHTSFPNMFESSSIKKIDENKLPGSDDERKSEPTSLADALRMQFEQGTNT